MTTNNRHLDDEFLTGTATVLAGLVAGMLNPIELMKANEERTVPVLTKYDWISMRERLDNLATKASLTMCATNRVANCNRRDAITLPTK